MTTKGICKICGRPGQGICYDCAIDSIEWHNERLPAFQRTRAELELYRRFGNGKNIWKCEDCGSGNFDDSRGERKCIM